MYSADIPETTLLPSPAPPQPALTPAVEDYLKAIYTLQQHGDRVSTTALCAQLGSLKPGSVSGMLRQLRYLASLGLVPGAAVQLTARAPFDGPLQLVVGGTTQILDSQLAQQIVVGR